MSICPLCGREYAAPPALSRADNKTLICPLCGTREALDAAGVPEEQQAEILQIIEEMEQPRNNKRSEPFYTVPEAAEMLKVHENTIYKMLKAKTLTYYKVGRQKRIPASELEKLKVPAENTPT